MDPHRIPNIVPMVIALAAIPWAVVQGWPIDKIALHAGLAFAVTVAGIVAGFGGGVVKLTAAIMLWLGLADGLSFMILAFGGGVVVALICKHWLHRAHFPYWPVAMAALAFLHGPALLRALG